MPNFGCCFSYVQLWLRSFVGAVTDAQRVRQDRAKRKTIQMVLELTCVIFLVLLNLRQLLYSYLW